MNSKLIAILSLASAIVVPAVRADLDVDIRIGRAAPPPPPEILVVEQVGPPGPPPWAQPRLFHRSYGYYYYPGTNVYYRPEDRTWFYLEGRNWRSARALPPGIRVDFGRAVSLRLDSDRPYFYHDRVVTYYPPTYFSRVRFRNDRDRRDNDHDGRDRDGDGRDRDRDYPRGDDRNRDRDRDRDRDNDRRG